MSNRSMEIATVLGKDVLLFHGMHAREELSRVSEFQLDLLSSKGDINLDQILGTNVTIRLMLSDNSVRYFNGYVTRFAQSGTYGRYHRYTAVARPWLWFLSRTADCRIFQEMSIPDIIKMVFADHGTADFKLELTGNYPKKTYCVQYRETDLNFVSRLMEQEGMYFYFRHTNGHNTMVLTDSTSMHTPAPLCKEMQFIAPERLARPEIEHISRWDFAREIQPGVYVHDDYDLERPSLELMTKKVLTRTYSPSNYEVYDYPGEYVQKPEGEQYALVRIDEFGSQFETAQASTNARNARVGSVFTLTGFPRTDQNREHLIIAATYDLEFSDYEAMPDGARGAAGYQCTFVAMSTKQQFRPRRATPKPFVQGPQTAVVVGPAGEEIHTDKYGRVKVQFHWDRVGKKDEKSSCWMRVSQAWAGKGWGGIAIPRIGQEVIVDFLEGDPDQPIITGRVYNAEQRVPYDLPAEMTKSTMKSNSSKGGGGFNELRFEDKKGSEQIYMHSEKDFDLEVKNDRREWIGSNRHLIVGGNRHDSVGYDHHSKVGKDRVEKTVANQSLDVGGDLSVQVGLQNSLKVGTDHVLDAGLSITENAGMEVYIKGGLNVVVESGVMLTLKGPGGFITIGPTGVTIQGILVLINSGGAAGAGTARSLKAPAVPKPPARALTARPGDPSNLRGQAGPKKTIYKVKPTLDDLLKDEFVDAELKKAWNESNPNAPEVKKGDPGSTKHEQGGGFYWNKKTGELKVERVPPGTRDGNSGAPPATGDWEKVSEFHTHPNTAAEGYSADPSPADKNYVKNVSKVPEIIETHEGRKTIPYP